jgi:hypothetical protein
MKRWLVAAVMAVISSGCLHPQREDAALRNHGSIQVSARLLEIPPGVLRQRVRYNHTAILRYEVLSVQRGDLKPGDILYAGHYNPWKPRVEAADRWVKDIGGTLTEFAVGAVHHLALEPNLQEHFMGGILNGFEDTWDGMLHWVVWANADQ